MSKKGTGFVPCTTCGGSGATTVTEIYIDNKGKQQTRIVRKVCTSCGGRGGYHV
jgi:DnaJ-class molecular chaperone